MFAPPQDIATEVFARVPASLRKPKADNEFNRVQFAGHHAESFLEGPVFDRAGNLYVVDIPWGRILRVTPGGEFGVVAEYDGWPNGLKFHPDGRLFVADYRHGILSVDVDSGRITPVCTHYRLERFHGVNDLSFASNGDLYFTDQGQSGLHDPSGRVFRLRAGETEAQLLLGGIPSPNGLVPNLEENKLYVAVTRANAVWRLPFVGEGVSKVGVFLQLSGGHAGPDGIALDAAGGLVVAHAGLGAVWIFSEMGEPLYRVRSCTGHLTTNIAFGGPDGKSLYITESHTGTVLVARVPVAGRPTFAQAAWGVRW
ncbi:MAG: SMP-30/gluconolactonase/LRE family protein [Variovorax sp.]|nr:SMP-30/gluconolactonase/LRE family protein [Variovorax sp.]